MKVTTITRITLNTQIQGNSELTGKQNTKKLEISGFRISMCKESRVQWSLRMQTNKDSRTIWQLEECGAGLYRITGECDQVSATQD